MTDSTDATLTAAQALVAEADRPRARALYLAILARDPDDEDAAIGLARVDAWDGCFALAQAGYRNVLARSPRNVEARAGLVDVLLWTRAWAEAEALLDAGLALAPLSPELLARRARVAYFRGDVTSASRYVREAERVAPLDPEVREAAERINIGQARIGQRVQVFPSGYDDVFTTDATAMTRWRQLRFEAGALVVTRYGAERPTRSGPTKTTIIDGRPSVGVFYHHGAGGFVGASFGLATPATALPRYAIEVSAMNPLTRWLTLSASTAFWRYEADRDVFIVSPALTAPVTANVDVTVRYWFTSVSVRDASAAAGTESVSSVGMRFGWRPSPRLSLGFDYTYGVQLERNPTAAELLTLRSHIVSLLARRAIDRRFGVDLALSVERRENRANDQTVYGPAIEAGVYARW